MNQNIQETCAFDRFSQMVDRLDAERIGQIPLRHVPAQICAQWTAGLPADKAAAVERLRLRRARPGAIQVEQQKTQQHILAAVHWLNRRGTLLTWLEDLRLRLERAEDFYGVWREQHAAANKDYRFSTPRHDDATCLLSGDTDLEFQSLLRQCRRLDQILVEREPLIERITGVLRAVQRQSQGCELPDITRLAIDETYHRLAELQDAISRLRKLWLNVAYQEMADYRERIAMTARQRLQVESRLGTLGVDLRRSDSLLRRLTLRVDRNYTAQLRQLIRHHQAALAGLRVEIGDEEVERWLAALVNASLDDQCQQLTRSKVDAARSLFVQIVQYRRRNGSVRPGPAGRKPPHVHACSDVQDLLRKRLSSVEADRPHSFRARQAVLQTGLQRIHNQLLGEFGRQPGELAGA